MISHPAPGQAVRVRYRAGLRRIAPHHDRGGVVLVAARRKPLNHLVRIGDELVIVPAGHLMKPEEVTAS